MRLEQDFSILALLIFGQIGGFPVYCRMFSTNHPVVKTQTVSRHCKMSPWGQNHTQLRTTGFKERLQAGCSLLLPAWSFPYLLDVKHGASDLFFFLMKHEQELHSHFLEEVLKSQYMVLQAFSSI